MTLAGSRTQVTGFSSADAITTKPRVTEAGPAFLSLLAFRSYILSVAFTSCGPFIPYILLLSDFYVNYPLLIPLYNSAVR